MKTPVLSQSSGNLPAGLPEKLLDWYDKNHRCLPWRIDPLMRRHRKIPNPYHVWLSEIMLQQTSVAAVKGYFNKFITLWPDIGSLSAAPLEDVLKSWAGLGYYSRARNLKATADTIARLNGGKFPCHYKELRALPGIGDYTAAAIMAIAYDQPYAVVDGNVERIMARVMAVDQPKQAAKKHIQTQVGAFMPKLRSGDFAQGMMDLGAMLCRPHRPLCSVCPWEGDCKAAQYGKTDQFPLKQPKKQKPLRTGIAFVAYSSKRRILLQKRGRKGLLAQMSEIPNHFGDKISKQALELAPFQGKWQYRGEIVHLFTHFKLEMTVYFLADVDETRFSDGWWVEENALMGEALPSVMKKALAVIFPAAFP